MKSKISRALPRTRALSLVCSRAVASLSLLPCLACHAGLILNVGSVPLQPNQVSQQVTFSVDNTGSAQSVTGLEFWVQIGDGYPDVPASTVANDGPNLTAVNLITGTAFAGNNGGQTDFIFSQLANSVVATSSGSVTLNPGLNPLATLTFDTTGFSSGSWQLKFDDVYSIAGQRATRFGLIDNGNVAPIGITFQNGDLTISAVPEPSTVITACVLLLVAVGHAARRWRRKRAAE